MTSWEELVKKARELGPPPEPAPEASKADVVRTQVMVAPTSWMEDLVDRVLKKLDNATSPEN